MDMKRYFLYFITIAALTLAGCGGGGGTGLRIGDDRATQDAIDGLLTSLTEAESARDAAQMTASELQTNLDTANGMVTTLETNLETANGMVTTLETNLDTANENVSALQALIDAAPTQGEVDSLELLLAAEQTKAANLQGNLDTANGMVTTLTTERDTAKDMVTTLTIERDAAKEKVEELEALIAVLAPPGEAPNAMSNAIVGGIVNPTTAGDPTGTDAANRPGRNSASDTTDPDVFLVTAGEVGTAGTTSIGADDLGVVEMTEDEPTPGQFMPQVGSETTLGGFSGSMYVRTLMDGDQTDTITVYTNEGDPGDQAFTTYYSVADRAGVTGIADVTTGAVILNATTGDADLFDGSGFPTDPNTFTTLPNTDDTMTEDVTENAFSGKFNGVSGMYSCGGSDACRAENDADGELSLTGVWSFTPADLATGMVQGVVHDPDYLSFGYWVQATTDEDGMTTYGVGTFYAGATSFAAQLDTLEGSASYSGKAAGMYGKKTFKHDGSVATLTTGDFTADANLMATFGGDDVAANAQNKLSGSVTNLMDDGTMVDPAWTVEFNKIDLVQDTTFPNFSGTTTGGGNYRGSFYGPTVTGDGAGSGYPTGVAGDFTGHFANGHVIGAFGATR